MSIFKSFFLGSTLQFFDNKWATSIRNAQTFSTRECFLNAPKIQTSQKITFSRSSHSENHVLCFSIPKRKCTMKQCLSHFVAICTDSLSAKASSISNLGLITDPSKSSHSATQFQSWLLYVLFKTILTHTYPLMSSLKFSILLLCWMINLLDFSQDFSQAAKHLQTTTTLLKRGSHNTFPSQILHTLCVIPVWTNTVQQCRT